MKKLSKAIGDVYHKTVTRGFVLQVCKSERIDLFVYDPDEDTRLTIATFKTEQDYQDFLIEAVLLHLASNDDNVSKIKKIYRKTCTFMRKAAKKALVPCFLLVLLSGCANVEKANGLIQTPEGVYSCDYEAGSFFNCKFYVRSEDDEKTLP